MVKVSIIMATYNCEDTLGKSIDSILAQTFTDWEFVICDDCSTDGTYAILQQYKHDYPDKFVILRNKTNSKQYFEYYIYLIFAFPYRHSFPILYIYYIINFKKSQKIKHLFSRIDA